MTLIGASGELGIGKTLGGVILAYHKAVNEIPIYSTIPLKFDYIPIKKPVDLVDVGSGFLLGDELWFICDSRFSGKESNRAVSTVCLRSRKKGFDVYFTQQFQTQIDIRIRFLTDLWIRNDIKKCDHCKRMEIKHGLTKYANEFEKHVNKCNCKMRITFANRYGARVKKMIVKNIGMYYLLYDTTADPFFIGEEQLKEALVTK